MEILYSFYDLSQDDFIFYGVTGTNGKTTTAFMAHNIIRALKRPSVYIGTLGAIINDDHFETKGNTTPGIFEIFQILQVLMKFLKEELKLYILKFMQEFLIKEKINLIKKI